MKELLYYNSVDCFREVHNLDKIPGGKRFSYMFYILGGSYICYDRTGNIEIPLNYKLMDHLTLPEYRETKKPFSQLCDERAIELYNRAQSNNRKIAIMYSGGIDSTLVITSFLRNLTKEQLKDFVILMNEESINENRNFYYDHIAKNFTCIPSFNYTSYITSKEYLLISGEQADMLFMPNIILDLLYHRPDLNVEFTERPLEQTRGALIDYYSYAMPSYAEKNSGEFVYDMISKTNQSCPIPINNIQDALWWHILVTKWQSCYFRMIGFVPNPQDIEFEVDYTTFFCNDEFQLWSMNNRDSIIRDTMNTYKFIQKEYIYEYNKDYEYYKNKRKQGSLGSAVRRKKPFIWLDSQLNLGYNIPTEEYFNYNNDFVDGRK